MASQASAGAAPQTRLTSGSQQPQQQQQQPAGPFSGRGIAIGGSDPNDRNPQPGRRKSPNKNYNQVC